MTKSFVGEPIGGFVFVNPGSGPVEGASEVEATKNIEKFVEEVGAIGYSGPQKNLGDGRWKYIIYSDDTFCEIEMPGLPLEEVRYIRDGAQNIWDFPRLYVDGGSWVWYFAVKEAQYALFGIED